MIGSAAPCIRLVRFRPLERRFPSPVPVVIKCDCAKTDSATLNRPCLSQSNPSASVTLSSYSCKSDKRHRIIGHLDSGSYSPIGHASDRATDGRWLARRTDRAGCRTPIVPVDGEPMTTLRDLAGYMQ